MAWAVPWRIAVRVRADRAWQRAAFLIAFVLTAVISRWGRCFIAPAAGASCRFDAQGLVAFWTTNLLHAFDLLHQLIKPIHPCTAQI